MSKQVTNTEAVLTFLDQEKAQFPAIRITEEPMLLTKSKIKRLGCKFSKYFRKKQAVKSRTGSGQLGSLRNDNSYVSDNAKKQ